jgi:uncharacterized protein
VRSWIGTNKGIEHAVRLSDITGSAADAVRNTGAYLSDITQPTVRLGVTGLARAGKTVFITALVHNLIAGARLPFFEAMARGRIKRAFLAPQPDDTVPRFAYEEHLAALTADPPNWPDSTRAVSQLRVTLEFEPLSFVRRHLGHTQLHVDIVDYPGEWLLDLPLLRISYEDWSAQALELVRHRRTLPEAAAFLDFLGTLDAHTLADEYAAIKGADLFRKYLAASRGEGHALSTSAPGRFLLPGDLEGTPALTFLPLDLKGGVPAPRGSLHNLVARRYDAYVGRVVKPFFRDHFSRLDRQIVLVDALAALNAGRDALGDLERALTGVLSAYRTGANTWASALFARRIDKILFAATKADHLHHTSHDRLENILRAVTADAIRRAEFSGADVKALALAAVRATREAEIKQNGQMLPCIMGVPLPGERLGAQTFDGVKEIAVFPGDLPEDPQAALRGEAPTGDDALRFLRFRPARASRREGGEAMPLPNIRLDRAIEFLIGDRLA